MFLLRLGMEMTNSRDRVLLWYMITAARLIFAQHWKQEKIPETWHWIQKMMPMIEMDKLTRKSREQGADGFYEDWNKFKDYMEENWDVKEQLTLFDHYQ